MIELFDYFRSVEFLGILLLSGGLAFLLLPNFYSFFVATPRRFWLPALTYDDADIQAIVRSTWLAGISLIIIGATLVAVYDSRNPDGIEWILLEIAYLLICVWIILKAILFVVIAVVSLWNWAVHGTPVFKKKENQEGNA